MCPIHNSMTTNAPSPNAIPTFTSSTIGPGLTQSPSPSTWTQSPSPSTGQSTWQSTWQSNAKDAVTPYLSSTDRSRLYSLIGKLAAVGLDDGAELLASLLSSVDRMEHTIQDQRQTINRMSSDAVGRYSPVWTTSTSLVDPTYDDILYKQVDLMYETAADQAMTFKTK